MKNFSRYGLLLIAEILALNSASAATVFSPGMADPDVAKRSVFMAQAFQALCLKTRGEQKDVIATAKAMGWTKIDQSREEVPSLSGTDVVYGYRHLGGLFTVGALPKTPCYVMAYDLDVGVLRQQLVQQDNLGQVTLPEGGVQGAKTLEMFAFPNGTPLEGGVVQVVYGHLDPHGLVYVSYQPGLRVR
jgi:hypothetical protein